MNKNIVLLGPPACGKGTQARQLAAHLSLPCLGTGKLLRSEINDGSAMGKKVEGYITRGEYVPDELILSMVQSWMDVHIAGWILDGFPRTRPQAEALKSIAEPDLVIALEVPKEELERRITRRRECDVCGVTVAVNSVDETQCPACGKGKLIARSDDALESFKRRYATYLELTAPLYDYYSDLETLESVDGMMPPSDVLKAILKLV